MANPQQTDAHLRIAHKILEQIMVSDFSEQQRRLLDFILRLSWGCGKKFAVIPHQSDFEIVGVGRTHVKSHLDWLVNARVIFRDDELYWFNKDYDQWRVSRALQYNEKRVTELVTLNLKDVTEKVTERLRKREQGCYVKGNSATPDLATPKESIKEILNKDINILPEWIDKDTWRAFLEMRRKKKTVPTERAKQLLVKELEKLRSEGNDPNEVLNQSIMRNYTGVFPLKGGQIVKPNPRSIPTKYTRPEDL